LETRTRIVFFFFYFYALSRFRVSQTAWHMFFFYADSM
jgi:hypothetical protein